MDDLTNTQNAAEELDGDVLGEGVGDDGLPGIGDFPPNQAVGVNDPNLVADDDVAMREARTRSEQTPVGAVGEPLGDLIPPAGDDGWSDAEQQAVAAVGEPDRDEPAAEVAAIHVVDDG